MAATSHADLIASGCICSWNHGSIIRMTLFVWEVPLCEPLSRCPLWWYPHRCVCFAQVCKRDFPKCITESFSDIAASECYSALLSYFRDISVRLEGAAVPAVQRFIHPSLNPYIYNSRFPTSAVSFCCFHKWCITEFEKAALEAFRWMQACCVDV